MKKAWISAIIFILIMSFMGNSYATDIVMLPIPKSGEVTLIIEMEGETAPVPDIAQGGDASFMSVEDNTVEEILASQEKVKDEIEDIIDNVDMDGFTYTTVFNGFSIKADAEDIETIMNIDGVKNVYISDLYPVELHANDLEATMSALDIQSVIEEETSYTGKGQVVAIIDSSFYVGHEMFSGAVDSPKYEETDIANIISKLSFGKSGTNIPTVASSDVYKSDKIPFAYDYGDGDAETRLYGGTSTITNHGTHVAGIVAGNNGSYDGETLKGVAPDAQLLLMKVYTTGVGITTDVVVGAMDDAVKMGACAINLSLGSVYISEGCDTLYTNIINTAREKGTFVIASAGNSGMELYSGNASRLPRTENIDYSTSGVPAVVSSAVSVGAADLTSSTSVSIPKFSSFGVTETLELNPEITAPGYKILSSVSSGGYGIMSGTSMSAPYITGAVAVLNEYLDAAEADGNQTTLGDRVDLIENLMMSTSEPIYYSGDEEETVPYSPRLQGAGLVSIEDAVATNAILFGDDGRTKLSLGEITDSFTLEFTIENMGDTPITLDTNSVTVTSDGYKSDGGVTYVLGTPKLLQTEDDLGDTITVSANDTEVVSVTVTLSDEDEIAAQSEVFTNGFFVDGFVNLSSSTADNPDISIPFMGFYGDWTSAPVLDKTMYDWVGSRLFIKGSTNFRGTYLSSLFDGSLVALGKNTISGYDMYDKERIAISPNSDGCGDKLILSIQPLRTLRSGMRIEAKNSAGATVAKGNINQVIAKFYTTDIVVLNNPTSLAEGDYTITTTAYFNYDGAKAESVTLPFTVDKTNPIIYGARTEDETLKIWAKDSNYIKEVEIFYTDDSGTENSKSVCIRESKGALACVEIDVSGIDLETATARAMDYAMNYSDLFSLKDADKTVEIESEENISQTENETIVEFDINNNMQAETDAVVIVAFYDDGGRLIAVNTEDVTIPSGTYTYSCELARDTSAAKTVKFMIWAQGENTKPICPLKKIEI